MPISFTRGTLIAVCLAVLPVGDALAATIAVPADEPTIARAIAIAADGDVIQVAPGAYNEGTLDFAGKSLTLDSAQGPGLTTLTTDGAVVVRLNGANSVLRGFTVTRPAGTFAAIQAVDATEALIEGNVLIGNEACSSASVLTNQNTQHVTVRRNVIAANRPPDCGPGSEPAGAIDLTGDVTVAENLIAGNGGPTFGGLRVVGTPSVLGNLVVGNVSGGVGGGVAIDQELTVGSRALSGNLFHANQAFVGGGAFAQGDRATNTMRVAGNTFVDNGASSGAGLAIGGVGPGRFEVANNTFSGAGGSQVHCDVAVTGPFVGNNLRAWDAVPASSGTCGVLPPAGGNSEVDPVFADDFAGDFHLGASSPLIDAGIGDRGHAVDVDGDASPLDGADADSVATVDVGFDEAQEDGNTLDTVINEGPAGVMPAGTALMFLFTATDPNATFECNSDMLGWSPCASPFEFPFTADHHHVFLVRAIHLGQRDRSPAMRIWRAGRCSIDGLDGADVIVGTRFADGLCAGRGDDDVSGGTGADLLDGGAGNDVLDGGPGQDEIVGGPGSDVASWIGRADDVTVDLTAGARSGSSVDGAGDTLSGIEHIWGGSGNDELVGDGADNLLSGGPGADVLHGGDGFDVADYSNATAPVSVDADDVGDDGVAGEHDLVGADIEDILGGHAGDTLTGNARQNIIEGGEGDDAIDGGANADRVEAGPGNDTVNAVDDVNGDSTDCGDGIDTVTMDPGDEQVNCENVVVPSPPAEATPPAAQPVNTPATTPTSDAHLTAVSTTLKGGKLTIRTRCANPNGPTCTGKAVLVTQILTSAGKPKTIAIGTVKIAVSADAVAVSRMTLSKTALGLQKRWGTYAARLNIFTTRDGVSVLTATRVVKISSAARPTTGRPTGPHKAPAARDARLGSRERATRNRRLRDLPG